MTQEFSGTIVLYREDFTNLVRDLNQSFATSAKTKTKRQNDALKKRLEKCFEGEPEMLARSLKLIERSPTRRR